MQRSDILAAIGIIAEFNPLHSGHARLIAEAARLGDVVCVMSGNFVQRGDAAIAEKHIRAKAALLAGADLVIDLPVYWAMSTAQNFALGGVSLLAAAGCRTLIFGSECGDISKLSAACGVLGSEIFRERLASELKKGVTFAAARDSAAASAGLERGILDLPNNNLGIEYMLAAKRLGLDIEFLTVRREGAGHDSDKVFGNYASGSLLREKLKAGDMNFAARYMPESVLPLFRKENLADIKRLERAVLATLRVRRTEELARLPDISEGIENKLFSAIKLATGLEELYNMIKTKRYTHARVRRLVLSAFLGLDSSFFLKTPPYLRVLGFSRSGGELLRKVAAESPVPVILRAAEINSLPEEARRVFEAECRAADLFALALENPPACGSEYTAKLIKTE